MTDTEIGQADGHAHSALRCFHTACRCAPPKRVAACAFTSMIKYMMNYMLPTTTKYHNCNNKRIISNNILFNQMNLYLSPALVPDRAIIGARQLVVMTTGRSDDVTPCQPTSGGTFVSSFLFTKWIDVKGKPITPH